MINRILNVMALSANLIVFTFAQVPGLNEKIDNGFWIQSFISFSFLLLWTEIYSMGLEAIISFATSIKNSGIPKRNIEMFSSCMGFGLAIVTIIMLVKIEPFNMLYAYIWGI